ncbi:TniQ family protein [Yoonia sp. MH D7]
MVSTIFEKRKFCAFAKHLQNGLPLPRQAVKFSEVRACVACLREDARRHGKLTQIGMAMRADWQLPFLRTCSIHNLPLITLWADRNAITRHDFTTLVGLKLCPITTGQLDPEPRQYSEFEDWVVRRINAGDHQYWFDQHDFYAAASFCELLGRAVMLDWLQKSARMTEDNWHEAGKIGFDGYHEVGNCQNDPMPNMRFGTR